MSKEVENTTAVEVELTPVQIAENFIKENTSAAIVDEFVAHYNAIESLKKQLERSNANADSYRTELRSVTDTVEEFLKEHIKENDSASVSELKELAEELNIELTKTISITFTVEVKAEITVPIDFDEENLTEGDFDTNVDYTGRHNDVELDDISYDIDDFNAEEN